MFITPMQMIGSIDELKMKNEGNLSVLNGSQIGRAHV